MCGRYTVDAELREIEARFDANLRNPTDWKRRYNAAPSQQLPIVVSGIESRELLSAVWGLIPSLSKEPKPSPASINIRDDNIRPQYNRLQLLKNHRCIVPVTSFFEWRKNSDGSKTPLKIYLEGISIFALAGVYSDWSGPDGKIISSFSIITTKPNEFMEKIHNRMPVILGKSGGEKWLNKENSDTEELISLLRPFKSDLFRCVCVSQAVGNVKNDFPDILLESKESAS